MFHSCNNLQRLGNNENSQGAFRNNKQRSFQA